jgi:hypothetical protein
MIRDIVVGLALSSRLGTSAQADAMPDFTQIAAGRCIVDGKPVDPASLQIAIDIVNIVDRRNNTDPTALNFVALGQTVRERTANPTLDDRTLRLFQTGVQEELQEDLAVIAKDEACIYAMLYSHDELQELRTFYDSPLGRKVVANEIPITTDLVELGQALTQSSIGVAAAERAKHKLKVQGVKL